MNTHNTLRFIKRTGQTAIALITGLSAVSLNAAGLLKIGDPSLQNLEIRDHQVKVTINNGFAQTEVFQTFHNPNSSPAEALYTLPLPRHASLSEMEILLGDKRIQGEVVEKKKAQEIYQQETAAGNDAGLAEKSGFQRFEFWVSAVPAMGDATIRTVYYQPIEIDSEMGKYVYPLEEGGTDDAASSFWMQNDAVTGQFAIDITVKSSVPVGATRSPVYPGVNGIDEHGNPTFRFESKGGSLNQDFVFYYMLQDNQPGRVEVIPFRADPSKPGTFMMVVTPGIDLQPLDQGADYVFVLDISGSMSGKLGTLVSGVKQTISTFRPVDRFRIVLFNNNASELTRDWAPATPDNVSYALRQLDGVRESGGTNLYDGITLALKNVDADRVTSMILVTDGVTNTGNINPASFVKLITSKDIRTFGFLMGSSANWELMEQICGASGGFYKAVSNSDDIIGQILLAKNKVLHECMHNVSIRIKGASTYDLSRSEYAKVFRGQQLILLGRYATPGEAEVELSCKISGQPQTYRTTFSFPEVDTDHPELERIWALKQIEELQAAEKLGFVDTKESASAILDIALNYQIVTDQTSMIVLDDQTFNRYGIERHNAARTATERQAQSIRNTTAPRSHVVDANQPAFPNSAPRLPSSGGGGGGAIDPLSLLALLGLPLIKRFRKSK